MTREKDKIDFDQTCSESFFFESEQVQPSSSYYYRDEPNPEYEP